MTFDRDSAYAGVFGSAIAISVAVLVFALLGMISTARGHHPYHVQYQEWQSNAGFNCCNNRDCAPLSDDRLQDGVELKVRIDSQDGSHEWCPVRLEHLLKVGKSPDWTRPHACIVDESSNLTACQRLKCFTDRLRV